MSRRVSFSPDIAGMPSPPPPPPLHYFTNHGGDTTPATEPMIKILSFRPPKTTSSSTGFSAMRFLDRIRAKLTKALGFVSSSSRKVSSSSSTTSSSSSSSCMCTFERSRSYVETFDSHRAQAIEDCIQFLNSSSSSSCSSSFQRSKSLSSFSY